MRDGGVMDTKFLRVRALYVRLFVVVAGLMLLVAAGFGYKAMDRAPELSLADTLARLPAEFRDLRNCEARGWESVSIHATDGTLTFACAPNKALPDALQSAMVKATGRYRQAYGAKVTGSIWAGLVGLLAIALAAAEWVARGAGKGFLLYEVDTPVFTQHAKRGALLALAAFAVMSILLSIGQLKMALYATAELPIIGFLLAWVAMEIAGRRIRLAAAFTALWTLLLISLFTTFPMASAFGHDFLGLAYILPALAIIWLASGLLPYATEGPPAWCRPKGIRVGMAVLMTIVFALLVAVPAEISDVLRRLW